MTPKFLTLLLVSLIFSFSTFAQDVKIQVDEKKVSIADGKNNAFVVKIYDTDESTVKKAWRSLMKSYNAKVKSKNGIFADNAEIIPISTKTVDVYATFNEKDGIVTMSVAFDVGLNDFLSSATDQVASDAAKKILYDFAFEQTKKGMERKKKEEEKELDKLKKKQKQLESKKKSLERNIENWQKQIKKAEEEIEQNKKDQEENKKAIKEQENLLEKIIKRIKKLK